MSSGDQRTNLRIFGPATESGTGNKFRGKVVRRRPNDQTVRDQMAQMEHSWRAHDYKAAGSASPNGPLPMFKAYLHLPATMLQPPSGAPLNAFSIRYTNFFDPLPVPPIGEHYNSPDYRTQERVLRCMH